jgi:uncharacterized damage-inducible protein DinB
MEMKTALLGMILVSGAMAQAPDLKTVAGGATAYQNQVKGVIQRSAEKMPDMNFAYKPVPEVRSFAQLLGHVADAQYTFCSAALGEKNPALGIEKSKSTKEELVKALQDAFAYCDKAYAALTDANAAEVLKFGNGERTRLNILSFNTAHNFEHYGNIVTYMRLKGLVPPSSEPRK